MKQPYIGNTKINKLYKGNELWCNWNSSGGGDTPIEPSIGYVTDGLMICCDAYGKTSVDVFDGFYDSINGKNFYVRSGNVTYGTNCIDINGGHLVYGNGGSEFGSIIKKSLKNTTFEIVFKCGSYKESWKTIITMGKYNPTPFSIKANINEFGGNRVLFLITKNQDNRTAIKCLKKTEYWNHIVVSIGSNDVAKIYVNGQYLKEYTTFPYDNNSSYYNNLGLYIGYSNASDVPIMSIGSFRYYQKALSESEVIQNYNYEQTITRVTTLNFPVLQDDYEKQDPPVTDGPGEMNKVGESNE